MSKSNVMLMDAPNIRKAEASLGVGKLNEIFVRTLHNSDNGEDFYIYSMFDGPGKRKAFANFTILDMIQQLDEDVEEDKENKEEMLVLNVEGEEVQLPAKDVIFNPDGSLEIPEDTIKDLPTHIQEKLIND